MPLFNPFVPQSPYDHLDAPVDRLASVFFETQIPSGYVLEQQGLFVETQSVVKHVNGDLFTTQKGDYISRTVTVVTAEESYEVEVTQTDIGGGEGELQIVVDPAAPPPPEVVAAVEYEDPIAAAPETSTSTSPYEATETAPAEATPESVAPSIETQATETSVATPPPYDPTYGGAAYPTEAPAPAAEVSSGSGEPTPVIDPSLYAQFGFT